MTCALANASGLHSAAQAKFMERTPDRQQRRPFPELARGIRSQTGGILDDWRDRAVRSIPELPELTVNEFKNELTHILTSMADALESSQAPDLDRLLQAAPAHGFQRFLQNYDLPDLFAEERVLRCVIVVGAEKGLGRRLESDEAAALHFMIDIMLQQGVLAIAQQQREESRRAARIELKYLAFLSHDLSNNFLAITMEMEFVQRQLAAQPHLHESAEALGAALRTIRHTREGMLRLLEHERLTTAAAVPRNAPVILLQVVDPIIKSVESEARHKGLRLDASIDPHATAHSDADLLTIILQNLIGNAVKHTPADATGRAGRAVRIEAERQRKVDNDFWLVSVIDDGPGIPPDRLERLFHAFGRVPRSGEQFFGDDGGFGLGLAIASEAARLIGTTIEVRAQPGRGSVFSFQAPAAK